MVTVFFRSTLYVGSGIEELLYLNDEPWEKIVPATLEGADEEQNVGQDTREELSDGTGV